MEPKDLCCLIVCASVLSNPLFGYSEGIRETETQTESKTHNLEGLRSRLKKLSPQNLDEELSFAVVEGNVPRIQGLLTQGANPNVKDRLGVPTLNYAIEPGRIDIARVLLAHGADVHARDPLGITPLICAAIHGHSEIAKILINAGAGVNDKTDASTTALMLARKNGHTEVVELLKRAGAKE